MRGYAWIAIIPLALLVLAANSVPPSSDSSTEVAKAECDCSNLRTLQIELRNALRLQQAFRNKIPELREKGKDSSQSAFDAFAKGEARRGLETIPNYTGPKEVDFSPYANSIDASHQHEHTTQELCRMSDSSVAQLNAATEASACAGIGRALRAHEDVHLNFCLKIGWFPYREMNGADRAQEEVEAYGAQIAVLRAEIAKVLERANAHIIVDVNTRLQMPPNPLYTAINIKNDADIAMARASFANDMIKLDGEGKQQTDGSIEGNCRFSGGMPSTLPARGSIETDGLDAKVHYAVDGTQPSIGMQCTVGNKTGSGMSIPVHIGGNNTGDFNLPLEDGASKEFDQSTGESAQVMARGGAKMTGKGTIRLALCNPPK